MSGVTSRIECANCGSHVTDDYARVFSPEDDPDEVACCPYCPDKIRAGAGDKHIREARSVRRSQR